VVLKATANTMSREQNIQSLMAMGFPRDRCEEALRINGYVDSSLDWLMKHPPGWDTPHSLSGGGDTEPQSLAGIGGWNSLGGQSVGSNQPVAAQEPVAPKRVMTQEEKEEAVKKLQERIKKEKAESVVANEKAEMESEMMRREQGKASIEAKEEWDRQQAEKAAREARKDRERSLRVEAEAKERIRVAAYNRELEYNARMGIKTEAPTPVVAPKKDFQECIIQIRLPPPHNRLQNTFKPTDTLQDVVDFISTSAPAINFKYQLMIPGIGAKKTYSGESLVTTLAEADLVPRGAIIVEKL